MSDKMMTKKELESYRKRQERHAIKLQMGQFKGDSTQEDPEKENVGSIEEPIIDSEE